MLYWHERSGTVLPKQCVIFKQNKRDNRETTLRPTGRDTNMNTYYTWAFRFYIYKIIRYKTLSFYFSL